MTRFSSYADHVAARLVRANWTPYVAVDDGDGVLHTVALPGEAFQVEVELAPGRHHQLPYDVRATCTVDGRCPGYTYEMGKLAGTTYCFEGWLEPTVKQGSRIRAFTFAKSQYQDFTGAGRPAVSLAGSIKVTFEFIKLVPRVVKPGELQFPTDTTRSAAAAPSVDKLPVGKKFFNAPSLVAEKGEPVKLAGYDWTRKLAPPYMNQLHGSITVIELRYELPSTLLARGLLDIALPAHKALLDAEIPPAPERGAKREHDGSGGGGTAAHGAVVDLTREPPDPLLEVCCDLTEEATEPVWTVRKKRPEEIS